MSKIVDRPVAASDKVNEVLARDERLIDVFVRHSAHFEKLRNPALRRVMARLVTVDQAARIAGTEPDRLVQELNRALGYTSDDAPAGGDPVSIDAPAGGDPVSIDAPALTEGTWHPGEWGAPIVEVDVREDLRNGREPFARIMAAVGGLHPGEVLCLRAPFEPVPLFAVLQKRGFDHRAEQLLADDWRVWFFRSDVKTSDTAREDQAAVPESSVLVVAQSPSEIVLDVRGLEPPEPMQRTLNALTDLPDGAVLVQVNVRVPQFLLPILKERGFDYEIHEPATERVIVRIWRTSPDAAP